MKRILITTYQEAFLNNGGGEREIHILKESLNTRGVLADIYGPTSLPLSAYDVVIHFSMDTDSERIVERIREYRKRLILWPNLWFISEPTKQHIDRLRKFLNYFDAVVFKSEAEEAHFSRYFELTNQQIIRAAPLVSQKFTRTEFSNVFRETHGLGRYAIWPGIIEPQKNQLMAVRAFKNLDIELVISGAVRDQIYLEQCRIEAGDNVRFIPAMPFASELHLSALGNCELFIELSLDFPGASALEAAAMGCPLLLSRSPWTEELLGDYCLQVDPRDEIAIRTAVAYHSESKNSISKYVPLRLDEAIRPLRQYLAEF